MQDEPKNQTDVSDEELGDVLIAISVVAKRLAKKIHENQMSKEGEMPNEHNE